MKRLLSGWLLCLSLLYMGPLFGQNLTISPYSRYAIGDIASRASARNVAMGGIGAAADNYFSLNLQNPAGYADLIFTTMEVSAFGQETLVRNNNAENGTQFTAGLQNIAFGFPARKGPVLVFGFAPFSSVGYQLVNNRTIPVDTTEFIEETRYEGEGGMNQAFIGIGGKLLNKKLRLGLNAQFRFGNTQYRTINRLLVTDSIASPFYQPVTAIEDVYARAFVLQPGVIFHDTLSREKNIIYRIGATADFTLGGTGDRFTQYSNGSILDTLNGQETGDITFPARFTGGFLISKPAYWSIGMDVEFQDWAGFTYFSDSSILQPEFRVALGGEWTPNPASFKYGQRINYRFGAYYQQSYITFDGSRVNDAGISLGIGLPAGRKGNNRFNQGRAASRVNFAVELGRRGSLASEQPLEELYARFRLGISLNDTWFIKRVVD